VPELRNSRPDAGIRSCIAATFFLAASTASAQFYKVSEQDHKWWFTRDEKPFWSFAVDCIDTGSKGTADNPSYNALAIYPSERSWVAGTLDNLKRWGFNSLGAWSDNDLFTKDAYPDSRIPYFVVLHLGSYDKAPWNDLYSREAERVDGEAAAKLIPPLKDDPLLVGYYTDNELGWWDDTLFLKYFEMPASAPGKQALIGSLKTTYGSISKLKADWKTGAASFEALSRETKIYLRPSTSGIKAVHAFNKRLAERYYQLMQQLIRKYDTNHMILGDRYQQYYNLETAEAAKPYVDVISTNDGADWTDGSYSRFFLDTLHNITGKPVVITEYYMAAMQNQTGNKNPGRYFPTVETQAERATAFANCTTYFASLPYVIGAQWFQFYDEPPKGRGDGEAYNMGLVDVSGKPYEDMVHASSAIHPALVHERAKPPSYGVTIPDAPTRPLEGLLGWDRDAGWIRPSTNINFADLYASKDKDSLYVAVYAMEYMDEGLYEGGKIPKEDRPLLKLQAGSWKGEVRFNGKGQKAICSDPSVKVGEVGGLKYTVILQIPLTKFGGGDKSSVHATLYSHGRGFVMQW
jgi:hypothetical protein